MGGEKQPAIDCLCMHYHSKKNHVLYCTATPVKARWKMASQTHFLMNFVATDSYYHGGCTTFHDLLECYTIAGLCEN